jgi:hypothetical protein
MKIQGNHKNSTAVSAAGEAVVPECIKKRTDVVQNVIKTEQIKTYYFGIEYAY